MANTTSNAPAAKMRQRRGPHDADFASWGGCRSTFALRASAGKSAPIRIATASGTPSRIAIGLTNAVAPASRPATTAHPTAPDAAAARMDMNVAKTDAVSVAAASVSLSTDMELWMPGRSSVVINPATDAATTDFDVCITNQMTAAVSATQITCCAAIAPG